MPSPDPRNQTARGGRPRSENPRSEVFRLRLTPEELIRLSERAWREGRTLADFAREAILRAVGVLPPEADRFGAHDRAAHRHFGVPRRDPRVRTAPHGDALDTTAGEPDDLDAWYPFFAVDPGGDPPPAIGRRLPGIFMLEHAHGPFHSLWERPGGRFDWVADLRRPEPPLGVLRPTGPTSFWNAPASNTLTAAALEALARRRYDAEMAENGMGC